MRIGDRVCKIVGQLRVGSIGEITGELPLSDGTKMFNVKYPEWSTPVLEMASSLKVEECEVECEAPVQLSLF
ncbi:hypothetical protein NIES4101_53230 [Calothrix sp. NIES-4101]|nr:hypothetical protein NIES4101_53230 [Calothrix sp. NIES-4101]